MSSLARAIESGDLAELPSRRDEDWHWTDLRGLIRVLPPAPKPFEGQLPAPRFEAFIEARIVNGDVPALIRVAPGEGQNASLRIIAAGEASAHVASARIEVAAGGRLTLFETYEGLAEGAVAEADLEFVLGEGAQLERIVLAEDAGDGVLVSRAEVTLATAAVFAQTVVTSGAKRQRIETRVAHPGHGASARLDGIYLLAGQQHADLTTVVTHAGVGGTTQQLTKGVVSGQGRGVFQGRIVVAEGADQTDARMGHHALLLSDRAEVDAKPELEIFADDVACAHGNTVGALDEDALFYAEQRGIPEPEARAMLTEAFVGEVVDRIAHERARDVVRAWVAERLGAVS
jgi:Fe-S cluster assembly protein SufD